MPRLPSKIPRNHKFAVQWNLMVDYLRSLRPAVSEGVQTTHTSQGVIRLAGRRRGGGSGWRWADPRLYDKETAYSRDEIVVVTPDNTVVTDGHEDPDSLETVYTQAGLWVCLRNPKLIVPDTDPVEYAIHTPQWPTPTADDPDAEDVYWWPISFYPLCY